MRPELAIHAIIVTLVMALLSVNTALAGEPAASFIHMIRRLH